MWLAVMCKYPEACSHQLKAVQIPRPWSSRDMYLLPLIVSFRTFLCGAWYYYLWSQEPISIIDNTYYICWFYASGHKVTGEWKVEDQGTGHWFHTKWSLISNSTCKVLGTSRSAARLYEVDGFRKLSDRDIINVWPRVVPGVVMVAWRHSCTVTTPRSVIVCTQ